MAAEYLVAIYRDGAAQAPNVTTNPRRTLSLPKGTRLTIDIDVMNPSGVPVDLAAVSPILFEVRKNPEPSNAPALISVAASAPSGAPRGRTRVSLEPSASVNLQPGRYVWGLRGRFPGNAWESLIGLSPLHVEPVAGASLT